MGFVHIMDEINVDELFSRHNDDVYIFLEDLYVQKTPEIYKLTVSVKNLEKLNKVFDQIIEKNGFGKSFFEFEVI